MSRLVTWTWVAIGGAVVLLAVLPLPAATTAADQRLRWAPHVAAWGIGLVVVVVAGALGGRLARHLVPRHFRWPRVPRWVVPVLAVLLAALAAHIMTSVFARNPHLVDEIAQLLHARAFAAGRLALPPPEPPEAFLVVHTGITDAGWISQYPPGHSALLAVGLVLGAEWLVSPLLGGLGVVLVYVVARGLYGRKTALPAAFLWAASAWVLFMSASYMNHVSAVTFALAAWAFVWTPRRPRALHYVAAGVAFGFVTLTRPLDGAAAGLPVLAWIVFERRWRALPWLAVGGVPVALVWGYVNWRLFGDPLTLGYTALYGKDVGLGFHTDPWGEAFTPAVALSNLAVAVRRLNIYLYEWPIPALLPLTVWALFGRHRHRGDAALAMGLVAAPLLYFFYWHSGFYLGPRLYYIAAPMLVIGTARAWRWGWVLAKRSRFAFVRSDVGLATAALLVLVWGWVGVLPARLEVYRAALPTMKLHPEEQLAELGVEQALVLVPESWGSRVLVQLWALGVEPGLAERTYRKMDTCALHSLTAEARAAQWSAAELSSRLDALLTAAPTPAPKVEGWPDPTIRLRSVDSVPIPCQVELRRDLAGFTLYGTLAWRNPAERDAGVVFARDLYEGNAALLTRYPGWEIWRYAPPPGDPAGPPVLTRIHPGAPSLSRDTSRPMPGAPSGPPSP